MRSIILRKVAGKLTPCWHSSANPAFGGIRTGGTPFLASVFGLALMTVFLVAVTWLLGHASFDPHVLGMGSFAFAGMAESNLLIEKRAEYSAKTKKFTDVTALISTPDDYGKKEVQEALGATDIDTAKEKLKSAAGELETLGRDVDSLLLDEMKSVNRNRQEGLRVPIRNTIPGSSLLNDPKSFGELVTGSKSWSGSHTPVGTKVEVDLGEHGLKTLLQTSAGWQPRTDNGTLLVEKIIRPVQVIDLFPVDRTDLFEIPSMEETTRTQAAAELAEAGTYQEDAFAFTRRTSPVRKIGSEIPVTDEQLDDVPGMNSILNNRLVFGVRARIDQQLMIGDGTGSTLIGLVNATNVQTQAKGADPAANAILKAITLVRVTGRANPTHVFMHGTDIQNLRLAQNAQGDYQFGPPYVAGETTAWGLPIIQTEALTQGTSVVASVNPLWMQLYFRKDVEVQIGFINDQFIKGQKTLRGDARVALWIGRGQAICKVTGL